jgi:hypothetical protein
VVSAALGVLLFLLSRLRVLDLRNRLQTGGSLLAVQPVALLAWFDKDKTLAFVALPIVLVGVVLLLLGGRQALQRR